MKILDEIKRAADFCGGGSKVREEYIKSVSHFFVNYYEGKNIGRPDILEAGVEEIIKDQDRFAVGLADGVKSYPNDKYALVVRLENLLVHLQRRYGLSVSVSILENFKCRDRNERLLKILKYLHTGDKSRAQIAEAFGISERVLSDDLGSLQGGFRFMGNQMQIRQLGRGTNTYRSMIHPVFLALNSEEIYTMTVGLKLLSRGTVFAESVDRVTDKIYQQLSDYARGMVDNHVDGEKVQFDRSDMVFLSTYSLMKESDKPFPYYLKEALLCRVVYRTNGELAEITGTLHLAESGYDSVVVRSEDGVTEVHIDDVVKVSADHGING